jgi:hypothetical protein
MISVKDQQNLFVEIARRLPREMIVYAIGGTAMMFLGFKESTQDIDLVFTKSEDRMAFKEAAKQLGYKEMDSKIIYGVKNNCPEMITLGDARLDLFLLDVIDFNFSETMQKRAQQTHQFGNNLFLKVADVHDIVMMKSATRRIKDEDDIVRIAQDNEIDWEILIKESQEQIKLGKERAVLDLISLLEKLNKKHKMKIPRELIGKLYKIFNKQVDKKK